MSPCCSSFVGLGSNLENPPRQIERALEALERLDVGPCRLSSLYRSEPVGMRDQPWFFNRVAGVHFDETPEELLHICQSIEREQGRVRLPDLKYGPRTIDLDLLLFGDCLRSTPELTLPHPRLAERRFVLLPLSEIAPEVEDPRSGLSVRELLERCEDRSRVEKVAED